MSRFTPRALWSRCALAGGVILSLLFAGWMAVSPELHEHLHHDAGHADHTCLATMIASGACEGVVTAPLQVSACFTWVRQVVAMRSEWVQPLFLYDGVLEHGPPVKV